MSNSAAMLAYWYVTDVYILDTELIQSDYTVWTICFFKYHFST